MSNKEDFATLKLFCQKAFKEQLKSNVKKLAIELEVYKQLLIVLEQTNEILFDNYLSTLCQRLHNFIVTNDFANYFDMYWVSCKVKEGVTVTEWVSVLILTCFARLFIPVLNTHT